MQLLFFKSKPKVDEFNDLRNCVYEALKLWRREIGVDELAVIMNYIICVGEFAEYSIFIPRLESIWINDLDKIKNYESWSIERWHDGFKLSCLSKRDEKQTTRHDKPKTESGKQ